MDVQKLINLKYWLEYSSFTLSLESYVILTNSLLLLQSENHFKKVLFWGIIQGLEADYYISFGYKRDALTERRYFYSEDCQNWKLLPEPHKENLALTELCKKPFQGDPGLVIEVVDDAPLEDLSLDLDPSVVEETEVVSEHMGEEQEEENVAEEDNQKENVIEEEGPKKSEDIGNLDESIITSVTTRELKEEDRVAATVHIITEETGLVPRGGIFKQTDGFSVHSRAFEGINLDDADSLCSFQHYRLPWNDCNTNFLTRCDYNYAIDFLDTIDKDIPADSWSAQLVEGDRAIVLRNLHWPGFTFFHYLTTPDHGFIYVGPGHRNLDIPFMTQVKLPPPIEEIPMEEIPTEENVIPLEGEEEFKGTRLSERARSTGVNKHTTKLSRLSTKLSTEIEKEESQDFYKNITDD